MAADEGLPPLGDLRGKWESRKNGKGREELIRRIVGCGVQVHRTLGPGFLESIYRRALCVELRLQELQVETEKELIIHYRGEQVGRHLVDVVVENCIILELKTVEELGKVHYSQLRSYLTATAQPTGLLMNFAKAKIDIRRVECLAPLA